MALSSAGASTISLASLLLIRPPELKIRDGSLGWGLVVGVRFCAEFILIYEGLQWSDAGRAAAFIYTALFFVAVGVPRFLPDERLVPIQWVGLVGICLALGTPHISASRRAFVGGLMLVGVGALWGAASVCAGAIAMLSGETMGSPSAVAAYALAYQTVWVGGITFLLWFWLLSRYPASLLQAGTSMTPLLGVFSASLILGEPLTLPSGLAVVIVVVSLAIVNLPPGAAVFNRST